MTKVSARILFLQIISESCCLHAKAKAKLFIFVVLSLIKKKPSIFSVSSLKL